MKVKVTQLCQTLCDAMDYTAHRILQARTLEGVAFPFSRGSSQPRDQVYMPALKEACESKDSTSLKGNLWKLFYLILFQNEFQIYSLEPEEMH